MITWLEGEGVEPAALSGVLTPGGGRAVHWRGALAPDDCAAVVSAARGGVLGPSDARDHDDPARPQVHVYGCAISPSDTWPAGPEPAAYHAAASDFRARLASVCDPSPAVRFLAALGFLAGIPAVVPSGPRGPYGSCTVRHLATGTALPPHCEHLYAGIDVYRDLRDLRVDLDRQLSFFVVLEAPAAGGVLRVYDGPWRPLLDRLGPPRKDAPEAPPETEEPESREVAPVVGDLLVFPSGATIHEVTEVQDGERWTMGGFAAFAPAGDPLYAWG
ncbi:MAG: 2OG-Fe(II) oxygenase [Polyangiaceae bacterium]